MNKIIIAILLTLLSTSAIAAQQTILSTDNVGQQRAKLNANAADLEARKADKDKAILDWSAHADGTTLGVGTPVWYNGKLYNTTQQFHKVSSSATPDALTAYFEVASGSGGVTSFNDLTDKPTIPDELADLTQDATHRVVTDTEKSTWNGKQAALGFTPGTAAQYNVGISSGNIPQLDSGGKIPTSTYNASGLTSLPSTSGQTIISSAASEYGWLSNVPLTTNPSGLLSAAGVIDLSGFQGKDADLDAASALSSAGANKYLGTNDSGVVGNYALPNKMTRLSAPPTTSNTEGMYVDITTGKTYYRFVDAILNISDKVYTLDPTLKTLTITPPSNGVILCSDPQLSTEIICPGQACSATAQANAVIIGITGQADSGYTFGAFTGDITGATYNSGTVTLSADRTGSATFIATALWAVDDPFTTDSSSNYTRISGITATLLVNTTTGKAYNGYGASSTGWFAHQTDLGSVNQVVQAVVQERVASTTIGSSGILINTDGASIGYGVWIDRNNSRVNFTPLGGVGTDVLKSFTSGAWVDDAAHLIQITRNGTTATIEIDFNDDGDFLDTSEQVGTATLSALVNGTKVGVGFKSTNSVEMIDNFRAKALL